MQVVMSLPMAGSVEEQSQHARMLWASHTQHLAQECSQVPPEELGPAEKAAQQWCSRFQQQRHSQKDMLQIKQALPDTDLDKFSGRQAVCRVVAIIALDSV